jgi:glycosyltransferase involved in cell wall biosynthesis
VTPGVRVILDARPLQAPDRAPATAAYLDALLAAFDADPLAGESFAFLLQSDLDDPTERFTNLAVVGRRLLPPTRLLRSGALTVDPFLLGGASLGAAWRAERQGAAGAVYHTVGGAVPLFSRVPTVVTLLDLAAWELPHAFQRGTAVRFGQRLRAQLLRDATAVIVGTDAVASAARRLLRIRRDRLHVVPLAPREEFRAAAQGGARRLTAAEETPGRWSAGTGEDHRAERERLGLPERYFVYSGRYDARHDLATLLRALADLGAAGRPPVLPDDVPWPPRVLLVGAPPDDRAALARAAAREGVGDTLAYAPALEPARLAALVAGARAALLPVVSEAAGLPVIEALAAGTPVVASAVGALPELVGAAGILVEPRDPGRLGVALATIWADDRVHGRLAATARERSEADRRTWLDVARDTREVYAAAGVPRSERAA